MRLSTLFRFYWRRFCHWLLRGGLLKVTLKLALIPVALLVLAPLSVIAVRENFYDFRDRGHRDDLRAGRDWRGAAPQGESFDKPVTAIRFLDQGWDATETLWFYTTTQGSNLMPYDLFMEVEQPGRSVAELGPTALFRDNANIDRYRYLPQKPSARNPEGLPAGLVKDTYLGRDYIGFTCAACHSGQINYNGTGIRIDGGPALADLDRFVNDLAVALKATLDSQEALPRFTARVRSRGHYASDDDVINALKATVQLLRTYNAMNHSDTEYGFARLDAFGRIYNRVLEHVLTAEQLRAALKGIAADAAIERALGHSNGPISGRQREYVYKMLSREQLIALRARIANEPNAPVSYPFLWDIPQHDYVQWNGLAANAGLGAVGRNVGEVIGVFGTLDWKQKPGFSISSLISGQGLKTHVSFASSINVHNLRRLEERLRKLQSPQWPADLLPPIERTRADRGAKLYAVYCAACHSLIDRKDERRRVVAQLSSLDRVGTDRGMAENSVRYGGWSGILRNEYVSLDAGNMLLDERAPAVGLLTKATLATVATPYPYENPIWRGVNWAYDLLYALSSNDIKPSLKGGNYNPDTSAEPLASLLAYKARPLNGIWATAPYLHNGSVPSLYALLLPKRRAGDPVDGEYRPDRFVVGSREFDPVNVGLRSSGYEGFVFDTTKAGNSNAGHEYTSGGTPQPNGITLPALNGEQRLDLVEYLKTL